MREKATSAKPVLVRHSRHGKANLPKTPRTVAEGGQIDFRMQGEEAIACVVLHGVLLMRRSTD
jgi:hypothetical protein